MKSMTRVAALTFVLVAAGTAAKADLISWNTWTSDSGGSMVVGLTPVTVTFSTASYHQDIANYPSWTPASTYADGVVVGNAPVSSNGIMQLTGGNSNLNTLTFSTPVLNPDIAIWSLGSGGVPASFVFNATPVFVAGGPSAEYGGSAITVSGNTVSGSEGNGTVQFLGSFSTISWINPAYENWYGFNVGAPSVGVAVPEPSSAILMLAGAVCFVAARVFRRK